MNLFPNIDPIPLPAPVWFFKGLHILTLALHFAALEVFLGGLLVAVWLSFRRGDKSSPRWMTANLMARRLPIVMTFVINLGVPPLLFAQVLYGRAFYTSSVLVGVYWISVIGLLMLCYWLLYRFAARMEAGRIAWPVGLCAWLLAGTIARIYSTVMTLMLRPEVWRDMYSASALGALLPPHDPTLLPRWLFMLTGGLAVSGLWMVWLAGRKTVDASARNYLAAIGGRVALVMVVVQATMAYQVFNAQPDVVRSGLSGNATYQVAGVAWLALAVLILLFGAWSAMKKTATTVFGWLGAVVGFVAILSAVIFRDGIRDLTLLSKGNDVWQRTVVTNGSVVGLFLVLFIVGLGVLGWLIFVMVRAKPLSEKAAA